MTSAVDEVTDLLALLGPKRLGELLRARREESSIKLFPAAQGVGIDLATLNDIESGRQAPRPEVVARLLELYGIEPDALMPKRRPLDTDKLKGHTREEILRNYVDSVRAWRKSSTKKEFKFRQADLELLVEVLGTDADEIERRLIAIAGCSRSEARALRKRFLIAVSTVSVATVMLSGLALHASAEASTPHKASTQVTQVGRTGAHAAQSASKVTPAAATKTVVGVLQPSTLRAATTHAAGISSVGVSVLWSKFAPTEGSINQRYVDSVRTQISQYTAAGMRINLSPGLQYAPSWVFALNSSTRFVDQHGAVWQGKVGEQVPDAVFNKAVHQAQETYLAQLGAALKGLPIYSVRSGGLCYGELRYPSAGDNNSYWAFDSAAQAQSPVPGWRPGDPDPGHTKAAKFIKWYLGSLTNYQNSLVNATTQAFPSTPVMVLYPAWGLRPGQIDQAIAGGLSGSTLAERYGSLQEGLDWASQVASLPAGTTVYTTNLAAPDQGAGVTRVAPVYYLAALATKYHHQLAGENAGGENTSALALSVQRAQELHLTDMLWMNEDSLYNPAAGGPSLAQLGQAAHVLADQ